MRKLRITSGIFPSLHAAAEEFNDTACDWGITDERQLVSVTVSPYTGSLESHKPGGGSEKNTVTVTFAYWIDE